MTQNLRQRQSLTAKKEQQRTVQKFWSAPPAFFGKVAVEGATVGVNIGNTQMMTQSDNSNGQRHWEILYITTIFMTRAFFDARYQAHGEVIS